MPRRPRMGPSQALDEYGGLQRGVFLGIGFCTRSTTYVNGGSPMAMQRQLWSVNGLATELLRDRRTVAKVLDGVPPDGYVNGHRRWHMATAVAAIARWRRGNEPDHGDWSERRVLLKVICGRLSEWQKRHDRRSTVLTVSGLADLLGVEPETVLTWLRAGMPFIKRGDFKTGEGFLLRPSWTLEWVALLSIVADVTGDDQAAQELCLSFLQEDPIGCEPEAV
jgi:hypothetical protein